MLRLLKALSLTLVLAALSFLDAGCGSNGQAQLRVVHALTDGPAVDVDVNGTKVFTNLPFDSFQPGSGYVKVPSGGDKVEVFLTGTSTDVIPATTLTLNESGMFTIIAAGITSGTATLAPAAALFIDKKSAPTSGNIEFRIVHATPSLSNTRLDVYIVPPGTDITNMQPQISLAFEEASYVTGLAFAQKGYSVIFTPNGSKTPLFNPPFGIAPPAGSIRTLVLLDNAGGGGTSPTPLVLNDVN
jgi:hypothetical protein